MAVKIIQAILKVNTEISEPAQVEILLDFIKPLITDIPGVEVDEEVGTCHMHSLMDRLPTGCLCSTEGACSSAAFLHTSMISLECVQDFQEEQDLVARLMHRLRSSDPAQHFAMLYTAWERLSVGGVRRLRHTIPPIAFAALHIARQKAEAGSGQPSAQEVISMPTAKLYRLLSGCGQ